MLVSLANDVLVTGEISASSGACVWQNISWPRERRRGDTQAWQADAVGRQSKMAQRGRDYLLGGRGPGARKGWIRAIAQSVMRYHDKSKLLNPKPCFQVRKHATGPKLGEKEKKKSAQTDANCESSINYQMTA